MIVADNVFREEGNRKVHIAGTFNLISASTFPARHDSMCLYLAVTNVPTGEHLVRIVFSYLGSEEEELFRAEGPIRSESPLGVTEIVMDFKQVVFPKPGVMEISFHLGDEFVRRRTLKIRQTGESVE